MTEILTEIRQTLDDLFQSGLQSVQDETLTRIESLAKESEQMGLHMAARELENIYQKLSQRYHQMVFDAEPVIKSMADLSAYLEYCREKASYDKAVENLSKTAEREDTYESE